jgi:AraC family transcriptional regulator
MILEKIQNLVRFIEINYNRPITTPELEAIAFYSYRSVQRIFKNIFKESLGEFQKRLKLEAGYKRLIYTQDAITDIALEVGFESLQAFTKSFKKQFGTTPTDARKNKKAIFEDYIKAVQQDTIVNFQIIYLPSLTVYFQSIKTNNYRNEDIENLWETVDSLHKAPKNSQFYGIIVDQPLITVTSHCRYEAGIDQNPNDNRFASKTIFGGRYAQYIHRGDYTHIDNTYRHIYKNWLLNSHLEFADSPIIEHYRVHEAHTENVEDFITEILIPLKKR